MNNCVCCKRRDSVSSSRRRAVRARRVLRQVADEGEALAVQAAGGQRQQQRAGACQRQHRHAGGVGGRDQRAAGVGHRRQAGFRDQADVVPVQRRLQQGRQAAAGTGSRLPLRGRGSSTICMACSGCARGTMASMRLSSARALRASSATQCSSAAARRITPSGSTSCRSPASAPRSSVFGTSSRVPGAEASASSCGRGQRVESGLAQQCAGADQRQADQRRRVVGVDGLAAARCPASRSWRCRRSRRALPAAGSARSRRRDRSRNRTRTGASSARSKPVSARTTATRGLEDDLAAAHALQLRDGTRVVCRACRSARRRGRRPGRSRSPPRRGAALPPPAPWPAPAAAPARPGPRRAAGFRRPAARRRSKGRRRRSSSSRR